MRFLPTIALATIVLTGCSDSNSSPDAGVPYCTASVNGMTCSPEGSTCSDGVFEGVFCRCMSSQWSCERGGVPMDCAKVKNGDACDPLASCGATHYPLGCSCNAQTQMVSGCVGANDMSSHD